MNRLPITAHLRVQDIVDILFLTVVAYHLYPSCGVQVQRQTMTGVTNRPAKGISSRPSLGRHSSGTGTSCVVR